jgi:hypothetical protein
MKTRLLAAWVTTALVTLALCTFPRSAAAQQAEIATPLPGKALIVVFRMARSPFVSAPNVAPQIAFDEQWISTLPKARYVAFHASPGPHKIAIALRMQAMPNEAESTVNLDVKAGETYYIKATPGTFKEVGNTALEWVSKESAQTDMAGSTPVDWAKDLLEGTLADVRPLGSQVGAGARCERVYWSPDIDSVKTSAFKRGSLRGTIFLTDDSLVLQLSSASSEAEPLGIAIPYADIAAVEVKNRMRFRAVVIRRKNGRLDSFNLSTPGGGWIDREQTQACGEQLARKLRAPAPSSAQ